jgi:ATP/maltotriose-dependent transcriptional regulator MalT
MTGSQQFVFDYLAKEFSALPEDIQEFLLSTSVLGPSMRSRAMLANVQNASILEELESKIFRQSGP